MTAAGVLGVMCIWRSFYTAYLGALLSLPLPSLPRGPCPPPPGGRVRKWQIRTFWNAACLAVRQNDEPVDCSGNATIVSCCCVPFKCSSWRGAAWVSHAQRSWVVRHAGAES